MVFDSVSQKNKVELALIRIENLYYLSDQSIQRNYQ